MIQKNEFFPKSFLFHDQPKTGGKDRRKIIDLKILTIEAHFSFFFLEVGIGIRSGNFYELEEGAVMRNGRRKPTIEFRTEKKELC